MFDLSSPEDLACVTARTNGADARWARSRLSMTQLQAAMVEWTSLVPWTTDPAAATGGL